MQLAKKRVKIAKQQLAKRKQLVKRKKEIVESVVKKTKPQIPKSNKSTNLIQGNKVKKLRMSSRLSKTNDNRRVLRSLSATNNSKFFSFTSKKKL